MKPLKMRIKYLLNLCSYLMISVSLLTILYVSYSAKHVHFFTCFTKDNQLIILYHKNYKELSKNDTIYYYNQDYIYKQKITQVSPSKYQIYLANGTYTTPSNYIGLELYTLPLIISISRLNTLLFTILAIPLLILVALTQSKQTPSTNE